jgi:CheY-like chemotaxis protein
MLINLKSQRRIRQVPAGNGSFWGSVATGVSCDPVSGICTVFASRYGHRCRWILAGQVVADAGGSPSAGRRHRATPHGAGGSDADRTAPPFSFRASSTAFSADLSMPVMRGIDAARVLKRVMPEVPIMIYSAHNEPYAEKEGRSAGVWAWVSKSEDLSVLLGTARGLVRHVAARLLHSVWDLFVPVPRISYSITRHFRLTSWRVGLPSRAPHTPLGLGVAESPQCIHSKTL